MKRRTHDGNGSAPHGGKTEIRSVLLPDAAIVLKVFGTNDKHLRLIGSRFGVSFTLKSGELQVEGIRESLDGAEDVLKNLIELALKDDGIEDHTVATLVEGHGAAPVVASGEDDGSVELQGFRPRTPGQHEYMQKMMNNDIVFCIGPAGTGKTYLAVVKAVDMLKRGKIDKIVLVRPAVEAGEKLGFLPGDLQAKVHPYLRPLYAALYSLLGYETARKLMEREAIDVIPLAYMRGQTLERAFVILDEGQNTTREQMKMFLTRMGHQSKMVVTGDETQIDLRPVAMSGLIHARRILEGIEGIAVQRMQNCDIVRHRLVWKIVEAYAEKENEF